MLTRIAGCRVCSAENLLVWIWIFKPNKKQSINRDTKSKVGIIAFSLDKGAVKRWLLASHSCTCNDHTVGLPWDCWNFDQKYRIRRGVNEPVNILQGVRTNTKKLNLTARIRRKILRWCYTGRFAMTTFSATQYIQPPQYIHRHNKAAAQMHWKIC